MNSRKNILLLITACAFSGCASIGVRTGACAKRNDIYPAAKEDLRVISDAVRP